MKTIYIRFKIYTPIICLCMLFTQCQEDPYEGIKVNEKSIENFSMGEGFTQIGAAVVNRDEGKVKVKVLIEDGTDFSKVKPIIQQSYRATVNPGSGELVDFVSNGYKMNYKVTSEAGQTRDWEVEIEPFEETITGTYDIKDLVLYGGTGPEYGGGAVMSFTSKSWIWSASDGPQVELDNKLTFTLTGVTPSGKTTGKFVHSAGADGKYANFVYILNPVTDINHFYRKIPKGEGTWERDYTNNIVTFISESGVRTDCTLLSNTSEQLGNNFTKVIQNQAFAFALSGTDDWSAIYSDYDKFVKKPRRYWVEVKKQN